MAKRMPLPPDVIVEPQDTSPAPAFMLGFAGVVSKIVKPPPRELFTLKEGGDYLPPEPALAVQNSTRESRQQSMADGVEIPVDMIDVSPYQPRITINEQAISDLGLSIAAEGQINAIIVRPVNGRYELICGERRWRAVQSIGKSVVRAIIRDLSNNESAVISLADNDAREDLTDYERSLRYQYMLENKLAKNAADIGRRVGKNEMFISRCMSFFKLPLEVMPLLNKKPEFLSSRSAGEFAKFMGSDDADLVTEAITKVYQGRLDVLSALNWLKGQSRSRHSPLPAKRKQEFFLNGRLIGEIVTEGKKVVITCADGVTADELVNTLILSSNNIEKSLTNG